LVGGDVLTPRAAALRYVLSNTLVTSAILGPRTTAQLDQLVREAGKGPPYLSDKALTDLPSKLLAAGIHT
ncbi:MAG TPA: aldo/keto reductase, partial [Polyangiaceae bacterium]|nr:aldo/keto reductase [Polyangiaceae bacterium]